MDDNEDRFAECTNPIVIIVTLAITVLASLGLWSLITNSIILGRLP